MGFEGISIAHNEVAPMYKGEMQPSPRTSKPKPRLLTGRAKRKALHQKAPLTTNQQKAQYVAEQLKGRDLRDELLTLDQETGEGSQAIMRVFQDALQGKDLADWEQEIFNSTAGRWLPKDT